MDEHLLSKLEQNDSKNHGRNQSMSLTSKQETSKRTSFVSPSASVDIVDNTNYKTEKIRQVTRGHANPTPELRTYSGIKLGWIQGVLIPCLLNIWGVLLFLRISWVVGQAGIGLTLVIVALSSIVCVITTLSLSAICTNGELQGGGLYYLVSRSLGAELGASVGIIFAFANAVAASMNTIGFCDSLNELLKSKDLKIIDNGLNDVRIVGTIALFLMCILCAIGMDWETKAQNFLIVIIVLAIFDFIIGAIMGPLSDEHIAKGFVGMSLEVAEKNWLPDYRDSDGLPQNFLSVFAMFFPALTGVQAGANICGDLRNPATAIPKGTLLALAISISSYLLLGLMAGCGVLRDASGDPSNLAYSALESCKPHCEYGLLNNYDVMKLMSVWDPLIYGGCWAATLSTALTNLLSVPRLIQALGVDRIYPGLIFFSKPYGKHGEPYRGYVLTFIVSLIFVLIAELNLIAPLISNFYLASYALVNFCTFHAALVPQLSWRPTFRCYNKWLSLLGCLLCVIMMVVISWLMALVTTAIFITLYLLVVYTMPSASWGSSTEAHRYQETISSILHISRHPRSIKSYNPQILVMAGTPYTRPVLLELGNVMTKMGSFMIVADVQNLSMTVAEKTKRISVGEDWLYSKKSRAFYVFLNGFPLDESMSVLTRGVGLGRFAPNMVLFGYQNSWKTSNIEKISLYVRTLQRTFEEEMSVVIFRISSVPSNHRAFDIALTLPSQKSLVHFDVSAVSSTHTTVLANLLHSNSDEDIETSVGADEEITVQRTSSNLKSAISLPNIRKDIGLARASFYQPALVIDPAKHLDVWWLYDDGGLNILLPYIIARRSGKKMPLRIFACTKSVHTEEYAREQIRTLLTRFRIEFTELIIIKDIDYPPSEASWSTFSIMVEEIKNKFNGVYLTSSEMNEHDSKIRRFLVLRELLIQYSSESSLIVMCLPKPRPNVSHIMYMTWLEVLSYDLPPMLFIRGNSKPVLDSLY